MVAGSSSEGQEQATVANPDEERSKTEQKAPHRKKSKKPINHKKTDAWSQNSATRTNSNVLEVKAKRKINRLASVTTKLCTLEEKVNINIQKKTCGYLTTT